MAAATETMVDLKCNKCGSTYTITLDKKNRRERAGTPNLCSTCMKEYANAKRKVYFNNLSKEEQEAYAAKRNWYKNLSDEEKANHAQRTKDQLAKRTKEEWDKVNKKNSEGLKRHWKTVSDEDKARRTRPMQIKAKERWDAMTAEERSKAAGKWYYDLPDEEKATISGILSKRMAQYNASLPRDEQLRRVQSMIDWHYALSDEDKRYFYEKTHQWYYGLSDEDKVEYANARRKWYNNLSDEEKSQIATAGNWYNRLSDEEKSEYSEKQRLYWKNLQDSEKVKLVKKALSSSGTINNFNKKFENAFMSSDVSNQFYIESEAVLNNITIHSWDYGIYDRSTNELVMVVDLDGAYFHADNCDYDGLHSKEEYDEKRSLSVPDRVKIFIFQELNFSKCFNEMIRLLITDYDGYIDQLFREFRAMPFPSPRYIDMELVRSYNKLCSMKVDDKYHTDISLATRMGDRLIYHFHPSIYRAHAKGCISPYDAWYDDKLLRKCIENRIIYQNHLNPNKILQGFNVSKIAPKVSVFSAGRAKILIHRYLSEFNEIFDPFSGFSGRMLGAISLGKRYVGQDVSLSHVNESNNMIKFLTKIGASINASVIQKDILDSSGEYECLFTCPPYADKEQWLEVSLSTRSCDEWIDICLERFKCKRYLFVVDHTEKYVSNVVDAINNRSHFNKNEEMVILI